MLTKDIQENFPFLSVVTYGGIEYIGIIINQDATVTSMYIYTDIRSELEQKAFLALGDVWWWESNRLIPINIFLRGEIEPGGLDKAVLHLEHRHAVAGNGTDAGLPAAAGRGCGGHARRFVGDSTGGGKVTQ